MKIQKFNFNDLYILDIANNHQGNLDHGLKIIKECAKVVNDQQVKAAIKFQFRNLPEFIHISERNAQANKHTKRFLSTQLTWTNFSELHRAVKKEGLLSMCTPFDEESVIRALDLGVDIIKVASCSSKDWPLLEKIADTNLPVIASTGGLLIEEVDNLVSFLTHKACDFALMHCVSIYPTPDYTCNLGNIFDFKERYPGIVIGWSTHEPPDNLIQCGLATALGARIFERHVGIETSDIKLNSYSSSPTQISNWIQARKQSQLMIGDLRRCEPLIEEKKSISELQRGVYARENIQNGEVISRDKVYFAFPCHEGQLSTSEWQDRIIVKNSSIEKDQQIKKNEVEILINSDELILKTAIHKVKAMLSYAKIPINHEFTTEYSHHYGISNFQKFGAILINVINRIYAKKIIIQLPGQSHPLHYHKLKEETFIIIWGELISFLDGREKLLKPGDTLTVPPGVWHQFQTDIGCIFEEISTTAYPNDSVYKDNSINALPQSQRKTIVDHWGRFQINQQLSNEKKYF